MEDTANLKQNLKKIMIENLMLQMQPEDIGDDQPLFGAESLGLDSVDALQIVVALDKNFGVKIPNPEVARQVLQSVNSMAQAVQAKPAEDSHPTSQRAATSA